MKRICRKSIVLSVVAGVLLVLLWGCAAKKAGEVMPDQESPAVTSTEEQEATPETPGRPGQPARPQTQTTAGYFIHSVKWTGESLSIIAGWYLGDIHKWEILRDCNPDMDPRVVHIGDRIRIPESLMTTKTPMTKAHVEKFYPKVEKPKSAPAEQKDEVPTLYGPK